MEVKCQNISFQPVLCFTSETPAHFQSKTFQLPFVIWISFIVDLVTLKNVEIKQDIQLGGKEKYFGLTLNDHFSGFFKFLWK